VTREVRLAIRARIDPDRLVDFLVDKSPRAASRARATLVEALNSLADLPDRGRPGPDDGLRELPVHFGHGSYVIQYRVDQHVVFVAHIFHTLEGR
jgi:plasmid stabilization system protein ParE